MTPKILSSKITYDGYFKIREDKLLNDSNHLYSYYTLIPQDDAVIIVAKTKDNLFLVIEEYRHPTNKVLLSLPGGYLNPNEDVLKGAERELIEETGFGAEEFIELGSAYPYPGISSQKIHYIYAKNASLKSNMSLETSEVIKPLTMAKEALVEEILSGKELDGILGTALFFYSLKIE